MAVREILLLGNPALYEPSTPIENTELGQMKAVAEDLHDTMMAFQAEHGWGRAIAAPQIGVRRRMLAMHVDRPLTLINPVLSDHSNETMEHWEDCMSFPELLVRLRNSVRCTIRFRDLDWVEHTADLTEDYAELLQHEVDHLDGVLSVMRAIDGKSVVLRRARPKPVAPLRGAMTFR